ncbi:MAG TPA: peptidylprolyl isomerase [Hyphomicrobiales bacterium]|nr:peptidylprolyl isomerase [Hyphomicrobiales bacterium]
MIGLLRQPLLHFLILGAAIFVLYDVLAPAPGEAGANDPRRIVVDRDNLLAFLQYRADSFDPAGFGAQLDALDAVQRRALEEEYVREEALYREALGLGMTEGDYQIRQRLVQKVEFLLENLASDATTPDDSVLRDYFDANREDYRLEATYSFSHVFFDAGQDGMEAARERAARLLENAQNLTEAEAEAETRGDRFPFLQDYAERTRSFVSSGFGPAFVADLDGLTPDPQAWQGPVASSHGYHLVQLRARTEPQLPDFSAVRERVLADYRYAAVQRDREAAVARVVQSYEVVREP